jgi:hypothetical protein
MASPTTNGAIRIATAALCHTRGATLVPVGPRGVDVAGREIYSFES